MVIPSMPGAPRLAFTRCHACSMFSRERICSNRPSEASPCFPAALPAAAGPVGRDAEGDEDGVETRLTSSGLREGPPSLLCPRLTSELTRRTSRSAAPPVSGVPGAQISLSKDVNSPCATGPFTSGTEPGVLLCCASLPVPSALYDLSVRRLIRFD